MEVATIVGFAGDILTFVGGLILSLDALWRDKEFKKQQQLGEVVEDLKGIKLTQDGITLINDKSVERVFIRQSVRRALWGTAIMAVGFIFLLLARIAESVAHAAPASGAG